MVFDLPRLGLGTAAFADGGAFGPADERASVQTLEAAIDQGITLIDTAPVYGFGRVETLIGRTLKRAGLRNRVLLATKVGLRFGPRLGMCRDSSPRRIREEVNASLKRLQTDWIDIYQVHWPDASTPLEATAEALARLRETGKIRSIGVSNYSLRQMRRFAKTTPLDVLQPPLNVFEREAQTSVLPYALSQGWRTLTYGALCRGLLSGRMTAQTTFPKGDWRLKDPKFQPPRFERYLRAVQALNDFAQERWGLGVLPLALRWVLDQPGVSTALWGARHPDQLRPIQDIIDWTISAPEQQAIVAIVNQHIRQPIGPQFMAPPPN